MALAFTSNVLPAIAKVDSNESGRVHGRQATGRHMTDDDGLDSVDSVRANHLGTGHDPEPITSGIRGFKDAPPQTSRDSRVGRPQDDEHALAALQGADRGRASGAAVAVDEGSTVPIMACASRSGFADNYQTAQRPRHGGGRTIVVIEHLGERRELSRVHVDAHSATLRWVSLIALSECQRGGDRRGVIRRVASAPGSTD